MQQQQAFPNRLQWRHIAVAVALVLLAFALRSILIYQRAAADVSFIPADGTDHHTYIEQAQGLRTGTWPRRPYYFHPAPAYFFAGIFSLLGDSIFTLSFVIALLDSLTAGCLIAAAWLLTKRAWGGYFAGGLYAVYPVAIFYGTTPLITPQATFLLALFLFFWLWQTAQFIGWRSAAIGLIAGGIAITRLNLLPVVGLYGLWVVMQRLGWRQLLLHALLSISLMSLVIAPFTYWNFQASRGDFIPVAQTGPLELYMANNRDSDGLHGRTPAFEALDESYYRAILKDIAAAPEHFVGLLLYKFALFWNQLEPGNNLTFEFTQDSAPVLRITPLNFIWLALPGLSGLVLLWYRQRRLALIFTLMLAAMCASYMLVFAFGRLRYPVVVPLIVLAAYTVVTLSDSLRRKTRFNLWQVLRCYALPAVLIAGILGFSQWTLTENEPRFPPKRRYPTLPAGAIRLDARFGDMTLVGWRPVVQWPAAAQGWVKLFEAYTIELFWQVPHSTAIEYFFSLRYVDANQTYDSLSRPIGGVGFPIVSTDEWDNNTIYGEIVGLRFDEDVPQARSGRIEVAVWYWDAEGLIVNVPMSTPDVQAALTLQTLAVFDVPGTQVIEEDAAGASLIFGEQIALRDYAIPQSANPGESITIQLNWEALRNIHTNYTLFLHVIDANDMLITQQDTSPVPDLLTSNWAPHRPLPSEVLLPMPESPGLYRIYAGLYNEQGRLAVDAADFRPLLAEIVVE